MENPRTCFHFWPLLVSTKTKTKSSYALCQHLIYSRVCLQGKNLEYIGFQNQYFCVINPFFLLPHNTVKSSKQDIVCKVLCTLEP